MDVDPIQPILDVLYVRMGGDGRGGLDLNAILEADRRALDEMAEDRDLAELGVIGRVAFGFYVEGLDEAEAGSLCNAGVTPSHVVFLDADASAVPGAELGRAPRSVAFEVQERQTVVVNAGFESMATPGAVEVRAAAVATWAEGSATFVFATLEGALESVDALRRLLAKTLRP